MKTFGSRFHRQDWNGNRAPTQIPGPTVPGSGEYLITPSEGGLEVMFGDQIIADFCYWNAGWGPAQLRRLGGNCGTALVSRRTAYCEGSASVPLRNYLWQVRKWSRSDNCEKLSEAVFTGVIYV